MGGLRNQSQTRQKTLRRGIDKKHPPGGKPFLEDREETPPGTERWAGKYKVEDGAGTAAER